MRVYFTTSINGDGSASVDFFETQESIFELEDADPETYAVGEGGNYFEVPDGTEFTNITIHSHDKVMKAIEAGKEQGFVVL